MVEDPVAVVVVVVVVFVVVVDFPGAGDGETSHSPVTSRGEPSGKGIPERMASLSSLATARVHSRLYLVRYPLVFW